MKIISFSIRLINLLYLLIIAIVFFSKKRVDNKETKVFSYILIANVIGLILEIVNYSLLINSDRTNIFYIFETKMILVYYFVWGSLFIGYELILFKKDTKYIKSKDEKLIPNKSIPKYIAESLTKKIGNTKNRVKINNFK